MIITDIRKTKKGRNSIYADGKYLLSIDDETLVKSKLKIGSTIDESIISDISIKSNLFQAKDKAFRLISNRIHSKKELKEKIMRKFDENSAEITVNKMEELGLVDDEQFARLYLKELLERKKLSINRAKYELSRKGISKEIIEDILSLQEDREKDKIIELLKTKYKGKFDDEKGKRRTISALQRLGYSWRDIKSALLECGENLIEDDI